MPAFSRVVFLGFQAAFLVSTGGIVSAPLSALATPLPLPMPLMPHVADYASRIPVEDYTTVVDDSSKNRTLVARRDVSSAVVDHPPSLLSSHMRRQGDSLTALASDAADLGT